MNVSAAPHPNCTPTARNAETKEGKKEINEEVMIHEDRHGELLITHIGTIQKGANDTAEMVEHLWSPECSMVDPVT